MFFLIVSFERSRLMLFLPKNLEILDFVGNTFYFILGFIMELNWVTKEAYCWLSWKSYSFPFNFCVLAPLFTGDESRADLNSRNYQQFAYSPGKISYYFYVLLLCLVPGVGASNLSSGYQAERSSSLSENPLSYLNFGYYLAI